jgi:predicted DNA-binding transcriptional regulator AlpA
MKKSERAKKIVTIAAMARGVRLSRARFYRLMREGIIPKPSRNRKMKRAFYDQRGQKLCLLIVSDLRHLDLLTKA